MNSQVTCVTDRAASQFRNKDQLYEFRKPKFPAAKLMLSRYGHGKNPCGGVGGAVKHVAIYSAHDSQSVGKSAAAVIKKGNTK